MVRPRIYRSEALVLKSAPFDEAGLILTLYTPGAGKLRAVAHGARKPTSKKVGHLEPLNRVDLALARPRIPGLDTVNQVQVVESFPTIKADLERLSRAIYLVELVDGFAVEGGANPDLYGLLLETLLLLDRLPGCDLVYRYFELHLLKCSGFMPELHRCVECRHSLSEGPHLFAPESGGALCPRCRPARVRVLSLSDRGLKALRYIEGVALPQVADLHPGRALEDELEGLLGATITYWLDREVRSKGFIQHLERFHRAAAHAAATPPPLPGTVVG